MTAQTQILSAGARFYKALEQERPLLLPGAINGYCARMAEREGFRALYLSGGGVAAAMGLPDLAVIDLHDVAADTARITQASPLPLLVDADTGFGSPLNINRTVKILSAAGAAGLHLEDQALLKRCGHRPNKSLVSANEMVARLNAAAEARLDDSFIIMARTDALASETREQAVARAVAYVAAGADMLFVEAAQTLDDYRAFKDACPQTPLLANITEFGKTPLFTADEIAATGVDIMLFPLSAFRAMNQAALSVYRTIRKDRSQNAVLQTMQTREALYDYLDYYAQEEKMNKMNILEEQE